MRRLVWGLLAALGLTMFAACGTPGGAASGPPTGTGGDEATAVDDTALVAATSDAETDDAMSRPAEFTILLTTPEGVQSPGLDALVSAVLSRPDLGILVTAPASDTTGATVERSSGLVRPVEAETMTGFPAQVVNGTMRDAMEVALAASPEVDLVVVGATSARDEAQDAAASASEAGVPSLVVDVGLLPDLAAAGMLLLDVLDFDLDRLSDGSSMHVLDVTACVETASAPGMVGGDVDPLLGCLQAIP